MPSRIVPDSDSRNRIRARFSSAVSRNGHGLAEEEELTRGEAAHEALVMGLRLAEGIDPLASADRIGVERIVDETAVNRLARLGLVEREGSLIRTTEAGRLLLDSILAEIAA